MKCPFCAAHFCYRCQQQISASDPYKHYRESTTCTGKLFDYDPAADGDWIPMGAWDF